MRLIKLIAPAATIAVIALFAPHAGAQTMGEYATTVGVASGGGSSMGTSIDNSLSGGGLGGGSSTWGASSLGGSFDERAGAAGAGMGADFETRAGTSTSESASGSRWPSTGFAGVEATDKFNDTSNPRFADSDRFADKNQLSNPSDRFPGTGFSDNKMGLDTHYASSSELDTHYSTSGELDNSHSSN